METVVMDRPRQATAGHTSKEGYLSK